MNQRKIRVYYTGGRVKETEATGEEEEKDKGWGAHLEKRDWAARCELQNSHSISQPITAARESWAHWGSMIQLQVESLSLLLKTVLKLTPVETLTTSPPSAKIFLITLTYTRRHIWLLSTTCIGIQNHTHIWFQDSLNTHTHWEKYLDTLPNY